MAELPPDPNQNLGYFNDEGANRATGRVRVARGAPYAPNWSAEDATFVQPISERFREVVNARAFRESLSTDEFNTYLDAFRNVVVESRAQQQRIPQGRGRPQVPPFVQDYIPEQDGAIVQVPHQTTALGKRRRNPKEETLPPRGQTSGGLISSAIEWGVARKLALTSAQLGYGSGGKFPDISQSWLASAPELHGIPHVNPEITDPGVWAPRRAAPSQQNLEWDFDDFLAAAAAAGDGPMGEPLSDDDSDVLSEDGPARWGG
jgi:hypothetical protein